MDDVRTGTREEADGVRLRVFAPDKEGTPFLIVVDESSASDVVDADLLGRVVDHVLATVHAWDLAEHPAAMRNLRFTLTICMRDDEAAGDSMSFSPYTSNFGVSGILTAHRHLYQASSGAVIEGSLSEAVDTSRHRLADMLDYTLAFAPFAVTQQMSSAPVQQVESTLASYANRLFRVMVREMRLSLPSFPWSIEACETFVDRLCELTHASDVADVGSYTLLALEDQRDIARRIASSRLQQVFTGADAVQLWGEFGVLSKQLPGLFPQLAGEMEAILALEALSADLVGNNAQFPPALHFDSATQSIAVLASFTCDAPVLPPRSGWRFS